MCISKLIFSWILLLFAGEKKEQKKNTVNQFSRPVSLPFFFLSVLFSFYFITVKGMQSRAWKQCVKFYWWIWKVVCEMFICSFRISFFFYFFFSFASYNYFWANDFRRQPVLFLKENKTRVKGYYRLCNEHENCQNFSFIMSYSDHHLFEFQDLDLWFDQHFRHSPRKATNT